MEKVVKNYKENLGEEEINLVSIHFREREREREKSHI